MANYSHKRIGAQENIHHWSFCSLKGKLWNLCKYGPTTALILVLLYYSPAIYLFFFCFHLEICCCTVAKSCLTLCELMDCSTSGFPILHHLPELAQTQIHWVGDAIQPSHPLSPPSSLVLNLSQFQGLYQWVGSLQQVAKVLEFLF